MDWIEACFMAHESRVSAGILAVESFPEDADRCWCCGSSSRRLQKCHIIPRMLGGSDDPSNLIPMCGLCHDRSPDVKSSTYIFSWIEAQQNPLSGLGHGRYWEHVLPALTQVAPTISQDDHAAYVKDVLMLLRSACGLHGLQHTGGVCLKTSTIVWAIHAAAEKYLVYEQISLPMEAK